MAANLVSISTCISLAWYPAYIPTVYTIVKDNRYEEKGVVLVSQARDVAITVAITKGKKYQASATMNVVKCGCIQRGLITFIVSSFSLV